MHYSHDIQFDQHWGQHARHDMHTRCRTPLLCSSVALQLVFDSFDVCRGIVTNAMHDVSALYVFAPDESDRQHGANLLSKVCFSGAVRGRGKGVF